jgi:hypothetical protein
MWKRPASEMESTISSGVLEFKDGDALWCATSKVRAQFDEKKRRESGAVTLKTQTSRHMKPRGESDLDKWQTRSRSNWIKCRPN